MAIWNPFSNKDLDEAREAFQERIDKLGLPDRNAQDAYKRKMEKEESEWVYKRLYGTPGSGALTGFTDPRGLLGPAQITGQIHATTHQAFQVEMFADLMKAIRTSPMLDDPAAMVGVRLTLENLCAALRTANPGFDREAFLKRIGFDS